MFHHEGFVQPLTLLHEDEVHKMLDAHPTGDSPGSTPELRIFDFSLRSQRRKQQDDPSAPLPQYTVQRFPLSEEYRGLWFEFTEGGVPAAPVAQRVETNNISGQFRQFSLP